MGVANSLALKIAGITRNSDDPVGGSIIKTTEGGKVVYSVCLISLNNCHCVG